MLANKENVANSFRGNNLKRKNNSIVNFWNKMKMKMEKKRKIKLKSREMRKGKNVFFFNIIK